MEIGIFYGIIKDVYREITDEAVLLQKVRAAGYSHIELDYEELKEKTPAFFREAETLGIGFSVYAFADENGVLYGGERVEACLPFLKEHNIRNLMTVIKPQSEYADKRQFDEVIVQTLNCLCETAEAYGITVLMEDFDSDTIPCGSSDDMLWFGSRVPKLKYTFDTGNFVFFGEDALVCFDKLKDKIAHVHLKDRVSPTDLTVTVTGKGNLPMKELLRKLTEIGYNKRLSVEMSGENLTEADLHSAYAFVRGCIEN